MAVLPNLELGFTARVTGQTLTYASQVLVLLELESDFSLPVRHASQRSIVLDALHSEGPVSFIWNSQSLIDW